MCLTKASERHLTDAFALLLDRHGRNPEIRQGARLFLGWSGARLAALDAFEDDYPCRELPLDPERLRAALFHDPRIGGYGLVRDLHDAAILAHHVRTCWTVLGQAAEALADARLEELAEIGGEEASRQLLWLESQIKINAPQALTVESAISRQLKATIPFRKSPVALPDFAFGPLVGAGLVFAVGALAMITANPWILPSIAPSAYLSAIDSTHPSTRGYNVFIGHMIALGAGFFAVFLLGAGGAPVVLSTGILSWPRVLAATVALLLTIAVAEPLRASHPPAGATALLVALGSLSTPRDALNLTIGAALIAVFGVAVRRARMGRLSHRRERREPLGLGLPPMRRV